MTSQIYPFERRGHHSITAYEISFTFTMLIMHILQSLAIQDVL